MSTFDDVTNDDARSASATVERGIEGAAWLNIKVRRREDPGSPLRSECVWLSAEDSRQLAAELLAHADAADPPAEPRPFANGDEVVVAAEPFYTTSGVGRRTFYPGDGVVVGAHGTVTDAEKDDDGDIVVCIGDADWSISPTCLQLASTHALPEGHVASAECPCEPVVETVTATTQESGDIVKDEPSAWSTYHDLIERSRTVWDDAMRAHRERIFGATRTFTVGDTVRVVGWPHYRVQRWAGVERVELDNVHVGDVGTVVSGPDAEGDFEVAFGKDAGYEHVAPECLVFDSEHPEDDGPDVPPAGGTAVSPLLPLTVKLVAEVSGPDGRVVGTYPVGERGPRGFQGPMGAMGAPGEAA